MRTDGTFTSLQDLIDEYQATAVTASASRTLCGSASAPALRPLACENVASAVPGYLPPRPRHCLGTVSPEVSFHRGIRSAGAKC